MFWASLGALAWTQLGYPLVAALLAHLRGRPVRKGDLTPQVSVVVAAHNEEAVIERRLQNLLAPWFDQRLNAWKKLLRQTLHQDAIQIDNRLAARVLVSRDAARWE